MAITLVETVGAANANTYATLAEADAYMETLAYKDEWANETDQERKKAVLVQSARLMNTFSWKGVRTYPTTQGLMWPRANVLDREGYVLDSSTIPQVVKDAQCEFALRLLAEDRAADAGGLAPETSTVGSISLGRLNRNVVPASVYDLIGHLLTSAGDTVRLGRA